MPRLFTALEIPSAVAVQLGFLQGGLLGARWIDRENFHITLRFIGDIDRHTAREVAQSLERVKTSPFTLQLQDLDAFGGSKPHSLFAGVRKNEALFALHDEQERICQRLGLAPDSRKFTPHVTIARLRGAKTPDIAAFLSTRGGFQSVPFEVSRFSLLSARASTGGGPYVTEESYELTEGNLAFA